MIRRAFLILLLSIAAPLLAQEGTAQFYVERVEFRGLRNVSLDVMRSEARLQEGRLYNETELREANDRVNRLPFLLDALFSLEKGTERDHYVLVVTVRETKPFFFLVDFLYYRDNNQYFRGDRDNRAFVGYRKFIGSRGAAHIAFGGEDDDRPYTSNYKALEIGYTQYDLFGRNAFVTVSLARPIADIDTPQQQARVLPQLVVGVPLTDRQALSAAYRTRDVALRPLGDHPRHSDEKLLTLTYTYNTTNDPFHPTRGMLVSVTPIVAWTDRQEAVGVAGPGGQSFVHSFASHTNVYGAEARAAKYRELSDRNSASVHVDYGYVTIDTVQDFVRQGITTDQYVAVAVRFSHSLWSAERTAQDGDSRIELNVRAYADADDQYHFINRRAGSLIGLSWVRRNAWGSIRTGLGWAW